MKKLLAVLALLLVASMLLVACQPEQPPVEETTPEETTPAPEETTPEETTPEETTPEETTPEETTPEETTPEETTEAPAEPVKVVVGISFDAMANVYNGEIDMDNLYFSSGSEYFEWSKVAEINHLVDSLKVLGWVAFYTETEGVLGYSIDGAEPVYPEGFSTPAEQGVLDHVTANLEGGKSAARMFSDIPVRELSAGEHTIALFAKDADGNQEMFAEFKLVKVLPYSENVHDRFSIDNINLNGTPYVKEGSVVAELAALNNTVTIAPGALQDTLGFRGWASFASAPAAEFGYYIGQDLEIITDASFFQERADLAAAGITNGAGYNITVSIADLEPGTYPVGVIAKLEDGTYAQLFSFYLCIEPVEPWDVDFTQVSISGSYQDPWAGNTLVPTLTAEDIIFVAHYGSIDLGQVDLSMYNKVTVTYATPVGMDTVGGDFGAQYDATAKRVLLLNTASAIQEGSAFEYLPEESAIITSAQYNMSASNMELTTVEIDLSSVEYNGQTYLTFDFRNAENAFGATSYLIVVTDILFE